MLRLLLIIDRSLRDQGGHSLDYDVAVADAAAACQAFDGVEIHADRRFGRGHTRVRPTLGAPGGALVRRLFDAITPMASRSAAAAAATAEIDRWHRGGVVKALVQHARGASLAASCARVVARSLHAGGRIDVFLQSAEMAEVLALQWLGRGRLGRARVRFHLVFRHAPQRICSGCEPPSRFLRRVSSLLAHPHLRVSCYTDTEELSDAFARRLPHARRFTVLPIPTAAAPPPPDDSGGRVRLGFLGPPRLEKGFALVAPLWRLLPDTVAGRPLELAVQIGRTGDRAIAAAIDELERLLPDRGHPGLTLLRGPVPSDEYRAWLRATDIVMLLYESPKYAVSSSGIFAEAIRHGIPVVTFRRTWMATMITRAAGQGAVIGEAVAAIEEVPAAVERLVADLARRRDDVRRFAAGWSGFAAPEILVRQLAAAGGQS